MVIKYSFFSLLLILCLSACTKIQETEIGAGLLPPIDGVTTKDTNLYINAKNWGSTDSISPALSDDHALGYVNDPVFGITQAAINLQLLPSFPNTFEVSSDSLFLDSVVLALDVRGIWGDSNQNLSLHVKELVNDQPFTNDSCIGCSTSTGYTSIIYNNTSQLSAADDVTYGGMASVNPGSWDDSLHLFKDSAVNMIRIRLTDELGNRLLHTYTTGGQYDSLLAFKTAFKGFQVSADAIGNSLLRIGLANASTGAEANTKLALYYRYQRRDSAKQDTTVRNFTINTSTTSGAGSAHSNYIQRQYSAGQIAGYYPATSSVNDDYLYIQSAPGTYATLTLDSALARLPNWIIHRAEIIMEQAPDGATPILDNYTTPYLFLLSRQSESQPFEKDTTKFVIPGFDSTNPATGDAIFSSGILSNYGDFGGFPRRGTFGGVPNINYYNFDVSRFVQGIVTNKNKPYPLVLYTPYREVFQLTKGILSYGRVSSTPANNAGIGRVKLYGGGTDSTNTHRMKLHIVYSIPH